MQMAKCILVVLVIVLVFFAAGCVSPYEKQKPEKGLKVKPSKSPSSPKPSQPKKPEKGMRFRAFGLSLGGWMEETCR
jgi:PBP1b-binding outer membrane lipoprotein LpoB